MQYTINSIIKNSEKNEISISEILNAEAFIKTDGIALAINNTVIPKKDWQTTFVKPNDAVLIIQATQGG